MDINLPFHNAHLFMPGNPPTNELDHNDTTTVEAQSHSCDIFKATKLIASLSLPISRKTRRKGSLPSQHLIFTLIHKAQPANQALNTSFFHRPHKLIVFAHSNRSFPRIQTSKKGLRKHSFDHHTTGIALCAPHRSCCYIERVEKLGYGPVRQAGRQREDNNAT